MLLGKTIPYFVRHGLASCQLLHSKVLALPRDFDTEFILTSFRADARMRPLEQSPTRCSSVRPSRVRRAVFPRKRDDTSLVYSTPRERSAKKPSEERSFSRRPSGADFFNTYLTSDASFLTARTLLLATVDQLEHSRPRFYRSERSLKERNSLESGTFRTLTKCGIRAALEQDNIKIPVGTTQSL
jgi:hypothetical protein